jgi:preprotein translocase subunit YajC
MGMHAIFAMAPAPPAGTAPNPTGQLLQMLGTFLFFGIVMYFVMIRPQQKKAKEQAEMMKSLKSGDKVVTSSGILGVIVGVKDRTVSIRSADTKLEILKSAVIEVTERSGGSSES